MLRSPTSGEHAPKRTQSSCDTATISHASVVLCSLLGSLSMLVLVRRMLSVPRWRSTTLLLSWLSKWAEHVLQNGRSKLHLPTSAQRIAAWLAP
eukprot:1516382-Amphidinium_carterae.1